MIKYIHIGYPKTLTTSLQTSFFSKHSQVLHLGVGCGSAIDFIDDDINIALENYILYDSGKLVYNGTSVFTTTLNESRLNHVKETILRSNILNKECELTQVMDYWADYDISLNMQSRSLTYPECEDELKVIDDALLTNLVVE